VKDKHLDAARKVAGEPITGLPHSACWPLNLWVVARCWFADQRVRYPSGVQPAFDCRLRWHFLEQIMLADLLLNRLCANQADLSLLQGVPYSLHNHVSLLSVRLGCMHGSTRSVVQTIPSQDGKALPPFAQPLAFAGDAREYIAPAPAFETQPNCLAAPVQFVIVVCHTASFDDSMAATTPCPRCREPFVN
jgi:hypothetical protein